jgi:hypothetical protein
MDANTMIEVLKAQRNAALDALAIAQAQLAVVRKQLEEQQKTSAPQPAE